jgi:hypothetical protein
MLFAMKIVNKKIENRKLQSWEDLEMTTQTIRLTMAQAVQVSHQSVHHCGR